MDHHAPRPPGGRVSGKRKVREGDASSSSNDDTSAAAADNNDKGDSRQAEAEPSSDNRILAGYLAYEFLRKGTMLGERFGSPEREAAENLGSMGRRRRSFEEVASILKVDGVHIPGIFNPSQLARWIGL